MENNIKIKCVIVCLRKMYENEIAVNRYFLIN